MKYELMKSFGNKVVILVMIILMCVNGLEIYYQCKYYRHEIDLEQNYTTADYKRFISEAVCDIENGEDVFLSKLVIEEFKDREITNEAYDSREEEFTVYGKYGIYGVIMVVLIVFFTVDTERRTGMTSIISMTSGKELKVIPAKQLSFAVSCLLINAVFLIESIVLYKIFGGLDMGMKLYNVPGYFGTWFSGNILMYKMVCTIGMSMAQILLGNLIYIVSGIFRRRNFIIAGSAIVTVVLYYLCDRIPPKYCFLNIFECFDGGCLVRDFILVGFGNIYTYRLWAALIVLFIGVVLSGICNFLIYRHRRLV